jgi:hypothetical protein
MRKFIGDPTSRLFPVAFEFIPVDRAHKVYGAKDTVIRTLICFTAERMTISGIDHRLMRAGF